jgi:multicomponent Na+:H+ antiporter subunit G
MNDGSLAPWIASFLLLAGALFSLLGAIGVSRLPDCYSRMHAASKAGALGAILILAGAAAASGGETALEAILALIVLLATAPLAAHAVSRAAWRAGFKPVTGPLGNALEARPHTGADPADTPVEPPASRPERD